MINSECLKQKLSLESINTPLGMVIAGAVFGLSSPGYNLWFIAWVGLIPWLFFAEKNNWKDWLFKSFLFGGLYHGVTMVWLLSLHPMNWIGFNTFFSLVVATLAWVITMVMGGILFALLGTAYKFLNQYRFMWLLFPVVWAFIYDYFDITQLWVPWARIELSQMASSAAATWWKVFVTILLKIQNAEILPDVITGLLLIHNVILAKVLSVFIECDEKTKKRIAQRCIVIYIAMAVLIIFRVVAVLNSPPESIMYRSGIDSGLQIFQGEIPIEKVRDLESARQWSDKVYLSPLEKTSNKQWFADFLFVYPEEGLIPDVVDIQDPESNLTLRRLAKQVRERNIEIIAGGITKNDNQLYNSLIFIHSDDNNEIEYDFYHKKKLVPFGEYTPFLDSNWLAEQLGKLGINYGVSFNTPDYKNLKEVLFNSNHGKAGGLICFELIDLKLGIDYKNAGADFLVNSSNLGWFHNNLILDQQFIAHGRLLAVTTNLPVVIANNVVRSGVVDFTGFFSRYAVSKGLN